MSRFWDPRLDFDRFALVERPRVVAMWPYGSNHGAREYAFAFPSRTVELGHLALPERRELRSQVMSGRGRCP
jgi:hypothetical protein